MSGMRARSQLNLVAETGRLSPASTVDQLLLAVDPVSQRPFPNVSLLVKSQPTVAGDCNKRYLLGELPRAFPRDTTLELLIYSKHSTNR